MEKIINIIQEIIPTVDLQIEKRLVTDGYIDSFDIVSLIDKLEEELGVSIPVESMIPENFESVDTIYALTLQINNGEV